MAILRRQIRTKARPNGVLVHVFMALDMGNALMTAGSRPLSKAHALPMQCLVKGGAHALLLLWVASGVRAPGTNMLGCHYIASLFFLAMIACARPLPPGQSQTVRLWPASYGRVGIPTGIHDAFHNEVPGRADLELNLQPPGQKFTRLGGTQMGTLVFAQSKAQPTLKGHLT